MSDNEEYLLDIQKDNSDACRTKMALDNITYYTGHFPRKDVMYLLTQKDAIVSTLLSELDYVATNYSQVPKNYHRHIFAMYLLAHFRSKEAFPKIIAILKLPGEAPFELLGDDAVTDYGMKNIIASTFNGEIDLVKNVIENQMLDEYVRGSALSSLMALVVLELIDMNVVTQYLKELLEGKLENTKPHLWAVITGIVMDLYIEELFPLIINAFQHNYIDTDYTDLEYFQNYVNNYGQNDEELKRKYHFIDTIKDMEWWACFQSVESRRKSDAGFIKLMKSISQDRKKEKQKEHGFSLVKREGNKIGRNDFCPCGSGKKHKKCCLNQGN